MGETKRIGVQRRVFTWHIGSLLSMMNRMW